MIKLVIFDLDGTLLDSIEDIATSANYALGKFGYPGHKISDYYYMVGNGIDKLLERALPIEAPLEHAHWQVKRAFMEHYAEHRLDFTKPYPGIEELLKELQHRGIILAVASNKEQNNVRAIVKNYFPDDTFLVIRGQREGVPVKPDPTIVYEIINIAEVEKNEVLYVGDTSVDMLTACNCGIKAVGVSWGFREVAELKENGADYIVESPLEILKLLV